MGIREFREGLGQQVLYVFVPTFLVLCMVYVSIVGIILVIRQRKERAIDAAQKQIKGLVSITSSIVPEYDHEDEV